MLFVGNLAGPKKTRPIARAFQMIWIWTTSFLTSSREESSAARLAGGKTLILDLDETLIHCVQPNEEQHCDTALPVQFPTGETIEVSDLK